MSSLSMITAQEQVDENAMFADTSSTIDSAKVVNTKEAAQDVAEKRSVSFSGEFNAYANPAFSRSWFEKPTGDGVGFSSLIVGNALLDVRLIGGAKAAADIEASYTPTREAAAAGAGNQFASDSGAQLSLREMFIDANYHKRIYLRVGKQVLQWGRCNLWNPTDLVNVERKTFIAKMGHREGTYGIKLHVPYKTLFNFYSFIDANNAATLDDLPLAVKAEALFGRTEMAVSAWGRKGWRPIFGFDLSSQLFNVQITAEASLRNGRDMPTLDISGPLFLVTDMGNTWVPRAAINLTRMFPLNGVADRLMVSGEFYYNNAGYDTNIFNDPRVGQLMALLLTSGTGSPASRLYEMNSYSKYYAALFTSISKFIMEPMSFSLNAIGNLNQQCFIVSTGIGYRSLHDFTAGISLDAYLGKKHTEYTFMGNGLVVRLQAGVVF
jgi:hypothetical protein